MPSDTHGKAVIFSAPSGAGKTTIVRHLLGHPELNLAFSVSATTRPPRGTEQDGVDYHFLTVEAFEERIDAGALLEWEEVYPGKFYGTLHTELERLWAAGKTWYSMWTWSVEPTCVACSVTARWPYSLNRLRWKCCAIGWKAEERTTRNGLKNGWPKPNGSWSSTFTSTKFSSTMI